MDAKELRLKSRDELIRSLSDESETLRKARFELAQGRVKNIRTIRETRRGIARLRTVLREKQSGT